ncbi:hypothetical protein HCQ94_04440 [Actinomyces sp. zg-332]|uniref:hypothetical protein n=1 Tax=Actinomyces sp. zg-332 TaxID=2708340 RepID=UPI001423150E|nr:hypothetical protein [Actinomyces sp. zg-332]QPK93839.1 hypothetical protein HCQ94_04440 [Actinomyces sp. zg-332]
MLKNRGTTFRVILLSIVTVCLLLLVGYIGFFNTTTVYKSTLSSPSSAPIVISKTNVLNAISNDVKISAYSKKTNSEVQLAIGPSKDVEEYAKYGNTYYAEIDRFIDTNTLGYVLHNIKGKPKSKIDLESDMWEVYSKGKGTASVNWSKKNSGNYSLIAMTDGKEVAPSVDLEWKVAPYSPYLLHTSILAILIFLATAIALFHKEIKNFIKAFLIIPVKQRIEFNKAVTQVDTLKVSEIQAYANKIEQKSSVNTIDETQQEELPKKRYPSRRQLREQEKGRK